MNEIPTSSSTQFSYSRSEKNFDAIIVKNMCNRAFSKFLEQQKPHWTQLISEMNFTGNKQFEGQFRIYII